MVTPTRHNARAAGAVVLAMVAITASDALVKGLLEEIKPSQFIFVRALVILLILGVALVLNNQRIPLPSLRQPWSLVRGGCELLSTSLGFSDCSSSHCPPLPRSPGPHPLW